MNKVISLLAITATSLVVVYFSMVKVWGLEIKSWPWFFGTKTGETIQILEDDQIVWKAQVFVKFFNARREFSREIKEAGKPYQPEREEVVVLGEASDWLPVWRVKGDNYNEEKFGLNNNIDSWFRASEYWVEHRIWIKKNELEIE